MYLMCKCYVGCYLWNATVHWCSIIFTVQCHVKLSTLDFNYKLMYNITAQYITCVFCWASQYVIVESMMSGFCMIFCLYFFSFWDLVSLCLKGKSLFESLIFFSLNLLFYQFLTVFFTLDWTILRQAELKLIMHQIGIDSCILFLNIHNHVRTNCYMASFEFYYCVCMFYCSIGLHHDSDLTSFLL